MAAPSFYGQQSPPGLHAAMRFVWPKQHDFAEVDHTVELSGVCSSCHAAR